MPAVKNKKQRDSTDPLVGAILGGVLGAGVALFFFLYFLLFLGVLSLPFLAIVVIECIVAGVAAAFFGSLIGGNKSMKLAIVIAIILLVFVFFGGSLA